jgi:hypothetical protein
MKTAEDSAVPQESAPSEPESLGDELLLLLLAASTKSEQPTVIVGKLVAAVVGTNALVAFSGQPGTAAIAARSVVDLHAGHVGKGVVLAFEGGDPAKPIVMGVLRGDYGWPLAHKPGNVEVIADDERLIITAKDQLVLRCGDASLTLTKAGKVLIKGAYVSSDSSGVVRLRGGSIQLN